MKKTYPFLTFLLVVVLGFALVNLLKDGLELAPWAEKGAEEGRLVANTKNVTRLVAKDASDLYSYISDIIPYENTKVDITLSNSNWKDFFIKSHRANPNSNSIIFIPDRAIESLQWSLPALYLAFHSDSPIAFFNGTSIRYYPSNFTNNKSATVYAIGPKELIPDDLLREYKNVVRIDASNPQRLAVKIAKYYDDELSFGWGRSQDRSNGYFHYIVTTPQDALQGLAAIAFSKSNNAALLYANDDGSIPPILDHYAFSLRPDWFVSPSEGPFRHFWLVSNRISYASQARLDFAIEKAEYPSMGPVGLGDSEALLLMFVILGVASALFVLIHGMFTLKMVKMPIKIAWGLTSFVLPILGPILYVNSYRKPFIQEKENDWRWIRPHSLQSATATAMGFGFGAPLMIAIGFILVWVGFPIFYPSWMTSFFWIGAGMPIMMFAMYIFAVLIAWLLAQYPMKKAMMPDMPKKILRNSTLITTALSMIVVSLGMMTTSWYMLMDKFPMMPKEDDSLWFGSMWLASFVGFLIAWPINWLFIRKHLKPGNI
jgi:hypothetical protein